MISGIPVLFVIGGPGSGKGTQCNKIIEKYHYTHLSVGDLLREECKSGSERGRHFEQVMKRGQLINNEEITCLLKDSILHKLPTSCGFLIDGFPRDVAQVDLFENQICRCTLVLFFDVPDDLLIARLLERGKTSGRADDNLTAIQQRLQVFHHHTEAILNRYAEKVKKIDGTGRPEEIFERVVLAIDATFQYPTT